MQIFSSSINTLIESFTKLPGIGPKTAQRLALHLLQKEPKTADHLAGAIHKALTNVTRCRQCQLLCESELCEICGDPKRTNEQLCVIESPLDIVTLEQSHAYNGKYFVLNGKISPLDGIGPEDLNLEKLKTNAQMAHEIILAISGTAEGEATVHFISEMLAEMNLKITRIAFGVPFGGELEYLDQKTLFHAFSARSQV